MPKLLVWWIEAKNESLQGIKIFRHIALARLLAVEQLLLAQARERNKNHIWRPKWNVNLLYSDCKSFSRKVKSFRLRTPLKSQRAAASHSYSLFRIIGFCHFTLIKLLTFITDSLSFFSFRPRLSKQAAAAAARADRKANTTKSATGLQSSADCMRTAHIEHRW